MSSRRRKAEVAKKVVKATGHCPTCGAGRPGVDVDLSKELGELLDQFIPAFKLLRIDLLQVIAQSKRGRVTEPAAMVERVQQAVAEFERRTGGNVEEISKKWKR